MGMGQKTLTKCRFNHQRIIHYNGKYMEKMGLTWINHRDGSKHVKTYEEIIFWGMNIHISQHIPAILDQQRGTRISQI